MATKRKIRRVRLGATAGEHRNRAQHQYEYARDAYQAATDARTCPEKLSGLCHAMRAADVAAANLIDVGAGEGRGPKQKFVATLSNFRKKLALDYAGVVERCVRKHPES